MPNLPSQWRSASVGSHGIDFAAFGDKLRRRHLTEMRWCQHLALRTAGSLLSAEWGRSSEGNMGALSLGAAVLVVEDDWMIAEEIESVLVAAGYDVVGPTGHLDEAIGLASGEPITAALLDIQLIGGDLVYPVAESLMAREIPFAFITSRAARDIDPVFRYLPRLSKPFTREDLLSVVSTLVADRVSIAKERSSGGT